MRQGPTEAKSPRRRAIVACIAALLVAVVGLLAWSASTESFGPYSADERTSGEDRKRPPVTTRVGWSPAGSLASDDDFVADAVSELDVDDKPVLLWAGEARRDSHEELTEFAVFAIPVSSTRVSDLFEFRTVGRGEDGWETVEGGVDEDGLGPRVGSFANTIVGLPFSEIEGRAAPDSQTILLTREDVTAVSVLPADEQTISGRTVVTKVDDEESSLGRYAVSSREGMGYTSTDLHHPLSARGWKRDVAERVLGEISLEAGHLATVGTSGRVALDEGTATVAAVAEHEVSELREGEPDATSWQAVVDLPDGSVDSATSQTMVVSSTTAALGDPDALSAGAPYALPVDEKRLGGSALVVTEGVQLRTLSGPMDEKYRDLTTGARTATIEPDLPALGTATDRATQIVELDEPSAAVIWANEDGDPVWSAVVRQRSDS